MKTAQRYNIYVIVGILFLAWFELASNGLSILMIMTFICMYGVLRYVINKIDENEPTEDDTE
jgi:Ca2+/Na+ antiporter